VLKRNAAHDALLAGSGVLLAAVDGAGAVAGVDAAVAAGAGVAAVAAAVAAAAGGAGAASVNVMSPSRKRRCQYWVTWPMFWPVAGKSFLVPGMGTVRPAVGMAYMNAPMQKARDSKSHGGR
jgi:hypothetical protein